MLPPPEPKSPVDAPVVDYGINFSIPWLVVNVSKLWNILYSEFSMILHSTRDSFHALTRLQCSCCSAIERTLSIAVRRAANFTGSLL